MPVFIRPDRQRDLLKERLEPDLSLGDFASLGLERGLTFSPTQSLARATELMAAEMGDSPLLDPDEANRLYGIDGNLSFTQPVKRRVAQIKNERKQAELMRDQLLSRAEGFLENGVALGADLFAAILDPVNIAASFIPIVREQRYARWMERLGKTRARLNRGAIEGLVGAAAVEPIVLMAAMSEEANYGPMDSLLNLTFGTVLGGGLHVVGGKVSDLVKGTNPKIHEQALRTAVDQIGNGQAVEVEPIIKADVERKPQQPVIKENEPVTIIDEFYTVDGKRVIANADTAYGVAIRALANPRKFNLDEVLATYEWAGMSRFADDVRTQVSKLEGRVGLERLADDVDHLEIKVEEITGPQKYELAGTTRYSIGDFAKLIVDESPNEIKVSEALVNKDQRNHGLGTKLYLRALYDAQQKGKDFISDSLVSEKAQHVWEALRRRGFNIEENPNVEIIDVGLRADAGSSTPWVYRIKHQATEALGNDQVKQALDSAAKYRATSSAADDQVLPEETQYTLRDAFNFESTDDIMAQVEKELADLEEDIKLEEFDTVFEGVNLSDYGIESAEVINKEFNDAKKLAEAQHTGMLASYKCVIRKQ